MIYSAKTTQRQAGKYLLEVVRYEQIHKPNKTIYMLP